MEDDHFINTVQELGLEGILQFAKNLALHGLIVGLMGFVLVFRLFEANGGFLVQQGCANIRGHDYNGIPKVYGASLGISQFAVLKNLEQHVEDVRMSLLDFVEQDDAVGLAAYRLGELTTLFIANISGRGTNQACRRMALHEFRHVNFDESFFTTEHKLGKRTSQLCLSNTSRTH